MEEKFIGIETTEISLS